jgi:hypothetical protein
MAEADGEPKFYLQEVRCPAAKTEREYTVAQWIGHEGLAAYHRENERFLTQVMTLTQTREARSAEFLQLLAGLWYDYSRVRGGETLREKYEQAVRGAARLIDTVIKLPRRQGGT